MLSPQLGIELSGIIGYHANGRHAVAPERYWLLFAAPYKIGSDRRNLAPTHRSHPDAGKMR